MAIPTRDEPEATIPAMEPVAATEVSPERFEDSTRIAERFVDNIETVVYGKRDEIKLVLTALMCGGHVLLEDVPGTAKTVLARAIAGTHRGRDAVSHPVHAGPAADRRHGPLDLRPEDARLRVPPGPDLRQRRPRRRDQPSHAEDAVRAARGDGGAPGDGRRSRRASCRYPFLLLATENPIEYEGTFPLPEAQLDRFFLRTALGYPGIEDELRILEQQRFTHPLEDLEPVVALDDIHELREAAARRSTSTTCSIAGSSSSCARPASQESVVIGSSVRGSLALERAARAWALSTAAAMSSPRTSSGSSCRSSRTGSSSRRASSHAPARRGGRHAIDEFRPAASSWRRARDQRTTRSSSGPGPVGRASPRWPSARLTFPLVPRRRVIGLSFGTMRSLRRGSGTDIAGSRPYRPGDAIDAIDWAASARLSTAREADEFVVRERFAEEAPKIVARLRPAPEMAYFARPLPWLDKPEAMRTVVELVLASAGAAGGFVGYLDFARRRRALAAAEGRAQAARRSATSGSSRPSSAPVGLARALDRASLGAASRGECRDVRLRPLRLHPVAGRGDSG